MAGYRTRFLRICMPRVILRPLSAYRREKSRILRLRARHVMAILQIFALVALRLPLFFVFSSRDVTVARAT